MISRLAIATIVATLALLAAAPAAGAAASNGSNATSTPTQNATDFSADRLVEWASEGADLSADRAEQAFAWFVQHQSAFATDERQAVRSWLSEQASGQSSKSRDTGGQSVYAFGEGDDSDETPTFRPAKRAISDDSITDNELPDPFEYRGERIFPGVRLEYEEWDGDRTTLILHAARETEISMNDAWLASAETDRPAPRHHATLDPGLNVIQMPTVEDTTGEEYIAMSTERYVETITDPFKPFIERISKRHIPSVAGGSILGFVTLFALFASFRSNRYRGRLVHIAEALRMR